MSSEKDLPKHLQARVASSLEDGAKPSLAVARYALPPANVSTPFRVRRGALGLAAVAVALLAVVGVAGNAAPRTWVVRTVNSAVEQISAPAPSPSPSPAAQEPQASGTPRAPVLPVGHGSPQPSLEPRESPEPSESPEPRPSPSPSSSPNPRESPRPSPSPSGE